MLSGNNLDDRIGFIRKTYAILSVMLTFSFAWVAAVTLDADMNTWMRGQLILAIVCVLTTLPLMIVLFCCRSVARSVPTNYILLGLCNILFTVLLCFTSAFYKAQSIVVAAGMTLIMVIALTIFACTTKIDITIRKELILIVVVTAMLIGLASWFIPANSWWHHFAAGAFVLIYSFYIVWHTQLIMGGKGEELSIDDYVVGALLLYIDIIYLFMNLLRLMGDRA